MDQSRGIPSNPPLVLPRQETPEEDDDVKYFNSLPPGFKFQPTDAQLIIHYLIRKFQNSPLPRNQFKVVIFSDYHPQELAEKYMNYGSGEKVKKGYFFTPRDRKYKNGDRPNRAAKNGYWKATGSYEPIGHNREIIGFRRSLVFYEGKPQRGRKTNWIMHEFKVANPPKPTLSGSNDMRLDDWVICSLYQKEGKTSLKNQPREKEDYANVEEKVENEIVENNSTVIELPNEAQQPAEMKPEPQNQHLLSLPFPPTIDNAYYNGGNEFVEPGNYQYDVGGSWSHGSNQMVNGVGSSCSNQMVHGVGSSWSHGSNQMVNGVGSSWSHGSNQMVNGAGSSWSHGSNQMVNGAGSSWSHGSNQLVNEVGSSWNHGSLLMQNNPIRSLCKDQSTQEHSFGFSSTDEAINNGRFEEVDPFSWINNPAQCVPASSSIFETYMVQTSSIVGSLDDYLVQQTMFVDISDVQPPIQTADQGTVDTSAVQPPIQTAEPLKSEL